MPKPILSKIIITSSFSFLLLTTSTQSLASDFILPFINIAGLGSVYSGWAAEAEDASTAYANPAGLVRLPKPQLLAAFVDVTGHTWFHGTATTLFSSQTSQVKGKLGGVAPLFYYAMPITDRIFFGFGMNAPFGLGTDYPKDSVVRYAATRSQVIDVDISPSFGIKLNDQLSIGLGLDIQRLSVTLNQMVGPPLSFPDSEGKNYLAGWGCGWHGGVLYQFRPSTRIGVSYNSQTMFHLTGNSKILSPTMGNFITEDQRANKPLPARAQISIYHEVTPRWAVMGSAFYNRWSILNQLTLKNTMIPGGITIPVTIPFEYHDTVDYAVGTNYKVTEKWTLKTGVEFFNAPSNDRDRSVVDPSGKMILLGFGAHYQQNAHVGYDVGYAHDFFKRTVINFVTPLTTLKGHSKMSTDIFGAQVTWNI